MDKAVSVPKNHRVSLFINVLREELMRRGFFEQHLYSMINYRIENTDSFKVRNKLYLRYNPEPDIWRAGEQYNKFFWIGSMFRDEKSPSRFHLREFTVIDIYLKGGTVKSVIKTFLHLLTILEKKLYLPRLSKLKIKYVRYDDLVLLKRSDFNDRFWLVLTDYPTEESFYDTRGKDEVHTSKFEIFYVNNGKLLEIAACGRLGKNLNRVNYIRGVKSLIGGKLISKRFMGFGFGLERLVHIYHKS
ncbi:MAG: hypothetical protein KGJ89_03220 [Patescibacteria group bacterium]|nr:hypothetical protein [Patescibacteria group bacterium]MDE2015440.1 hypothetical protein [Patescibacteria group bacterium]MDE2226945.1 hypothetical protein [Patescibacteria group bacterium]